MAGAAAAHLSGQMSAKLETLGLSQTQIEAVLALSRDVVGPRKMGYGRVFKINSMLTPLKDRGNYGAFAPDYEVTDIYDVYRILKDEIKQ